MYAFDYARPDSLNAALELLAGEGATPLAGGQTLMPTLKARLAQPELLVDLTMAPELQGVAVSPDEVRIGAAVTHGTVAASSDVRSAIPALSALAAKIGDPQVRNRGTLGGSVANNDPSACYPAAVLALDAVVETSAREIPAAGFFTDLYTTALDEGELVTAVRFQRPIAASWMKFPQPASRFSLVGVFLAQFPAGTRVAVTGASETGVFRAEPLEAALNAEFTPEAAAAVKMPSSGMIEDLHGGADYRAHLISVMAKRAVAEILG